MQTTVLRLQTITLGAVLQTLCIRTQVCWQCCHLLARLSFPPGVANESFMWQTTALGVHLNANAVHWHSGVLTLLSTAANLFYVCRQQQWESFACKCSALALRCADSVVVCCRLHVQGCRFRLRLQMTLSCVQTMCCLRQKRRQLHFLLPGLCQQCCCMRQGLLNTLSRPWCIYQCCWRSRGDIQCRRQHF